MPDQDAAHKKSTPASAGNEAGPQRQHGRRLWRWFLLVLALVLFGFMMREVLFPFRDQPYLEIGHGNHTHYVPKDRNENVPVSSFPMRPPGPDERITPDGDIVPKE